jgi:hypothetical protein
MRVLDWLKKLVLYPFFYPYVQMPGRSFKGKMPPLLAEEMMIRDKLREHVVELASHIGERSIAVPQGLKAAERYIIRQLQELGYQVWVQPFDFGGLEMNNVIVEKRGHNPNAGCLVVGAHYDTVIGTPGADDNATGVGAVIELARWLRNQDTQCTVRMVAFANEESGTGAWQTMGSYHYAKMLQDRRVKVNAMLSLEMLGVYKDEPGSQQYPSPFNLFYPRTANFIAFVGNQLSKELVWKCVRVFRQVCNFPSEGVAAPDKLKDAGRSDHWAFWQFGIPALMVTDTSNFRYPLYHTWQDTADKIDFDRYTRVVHGLFQVVKDIAG